MKVRFAPRALASIRYRHTWWRTHREKAPGLFGEELRDAIGKLRDNTDVARKRYSGAGDVAVWRLLLRKTRHYLYYLRDDAADIATILLVDSAVAEADPEL